MSDRKSLREHLGEEVWNALSTFASMGTDEKTRTKNRNDETCIIIPSDKPSNFITKEAEKARLDVMHLMGRPSEFVDGKYGFCTWTDIKPYESPLWGRPNPLFEILVHDCNPDCCVRVCAKIDINFELGVMLLDIPFGGMRYNAKTTEVSASAPSLEKAVAKVALVVHLDGYPHEVDIEAAVSMLRDYMSRSEDPVALGEMVQTVYEAVRRTQDSIPYGQVSNA